MLHVEIMAEDHATVAEVGAQIEQIMIGGADLATPERHHLHVAARARRGDRVFLEAAFVMDDAQHELRIESGPRRFVIHRAEELAPLALIGEFAGEPPRHLGEPRNDIGSVRVIAGNRIVGDRTRKTGDDRRCEPLLDLRAGECCGRAGPKRPSRAQQDHPPTLHPISLRR